MKNKTMRRQLVVLGIILLTGVLYIGVHQLWLKAAEQKAFQIHYSIVRIFIAAPLVWFSISSIAGLLVQSWANKAVSKKIRRFSRAAAAGLIVLYLIFLAMYFFEIELLAKGMVYFAADCPFLFIVPGALFAIGAFPEEQKQTQA